MDDLQMKRYKSLIGIGLTLAGSMLFGQNNHKEEFIVKDDVQLVVNTKHTNIKFETWNKNKVEIKGLISEENISDAEKERLYDQWAFTATGNSNRIEISSNTNFEWVSAKNVEHVKTFDMEPIIQEIVIPLVAEFSEAPISEAHAESLSNLEFDYDAYKKNPDAYMKNWEKKVEKAYGKHAKTVVKVKKYKGDKNKVEQKIGFLGYPRSPYHPTTKKFDFDEKVYLKDKKAYLKRLNKIHGKDVTTKEVDVWLDEIEAWEEMVEMKAEKIEEDIEVAMESFSESLEESIEEWSEEIEQWAENLVAQYETSDRSQVKIIKMHKNATPVSAKPNRTLLIKLPKNAKIMVNARFGAVDLGTVASAATVNSHYANVEATAINHVDAAIHVSYGQVAVANWKQGELSLNYVDNCSLEDVDLLNLNANSSNVHIEKLRSEAVVIGSLGELTVTNIAPSFENLDVILENTNATIKLPETDFNMYYNGSKSLIDYPSTLEVSKTINGGTTLIKGFKGAKNKGKDIHISAKYSDIVLE